MNRLIYLIAFTPSFERMRQFYENSLGLKVRAANGPSNLRFRRSTPRATS